jgi:hypothetical protein
LAPFQQPLFSKPPSGSDTVPRAGKAIFSTDARWLFVLLPTVISSQDAYRSVDEQSAGSSGRESVQVMVWHFSTETRLYEPAGPARDLSLMGSSRTVLTWNEHAQHVIAINASARRDQPPECHVFQIARDGASERPEISAQLTDRKVVAAGANPDGSVLALGSLDGSVALVSPDNYQAIGERADGRDTFQSRDGFRPIFINFGPAENELTLSSWTEMRTLNRKSGKPRPFAPPTFRDKVIRRVVSSGTPTQRLVATALYGRVEVARTAMVDAPAEPIVVRGATAIPQFSRSGRRILTLSGGSLDALDTLRVSDVTMLNEPQPAAPQSLENTPPPAWLWELAATVSALNASDDGSLRTLEDIRSTYKSQKSAGAYEAVWKRFFPDERSR